MPEKSVEFAWCRLFYLFGEGDDERRLVPYLHKQFSCARPAELKNANLIRDYLEVSKAGELITKVAMGNQSGPINICSGVPITIRQLAEKIAHEYDRLDLLKFCAHKDISNEPECILWNSQSRLNLEILNQNYLFYNKGSHQSIVTKLT